MQIRPAWHPPRRPARPHCIAQLPLCPPPWRRRWRWLLAVAGVLVACALRGRPARTAEFAARDARKSPTITPTSSNARKSPTITPTSSTKVASAAVPHATPAHALPLPCSVDAPVAALAAVPHAAGLRAAGLCRSLGHQRKFFAVRDSVLAWARGRPDRRRRLLRGTGKEGRFFAFVVTDAYAFRHIFKAGGTTVELQTHHGKKAKARKGRQLGHVGADALGGRRLLTTVRDPLDRFLSGWAECGFRHLDAMANLTAAEGYDDRVRAWLDYLRTSTGNSLGRNGLRTCRPHSMPQAQHLWQSDDTFEWHAELDLVGHLSELPGLLALVGFPYDAAIGPGNEAADNAVKRRHFPRDASLLSDATILGLCEYLALDYYLFDFDPPAPCREMLRANVADMNITVSY